MKRDGNNRSIWQQDEVAVTNNSALSAGATFDVVVVGAGITGISTALQLQKAGKNVLIAEARNIAFGTTGGTTAHLNNFYDTSYDQVIKDFGKENAQLFADAAREALAMIKQNIGEHDISCSYSDQTGYLFSVEEKQNDILEDLMEGTKEVGVSIDYVNDSPFPVPYLKLASVPGQAQFNPVEYVGALAEIFVNNGGTFLNNCRVTGTEEGDVINVQTSLGSILTNNLVYATHIPPGVNILHFRNAPYRSYVIAVKLKNGVYPRALGYDLCDPYHYYRSQEINGEEYLIAGGEDHKTGHEDNTENCFRVLEAYVRKYFDVESVAYKWSSQYFVPADGLPYIGHLPGNGKNVYTATGFNGNGMILGTISARILSDLIVTGTNKYESLFSPSRVKPVSGFANFMKEAADVVYHFVADKFNIDKIKELSDIAPGEAKVVKYEGHTIALYKDEQKNLHAVSAACTHINCTVAWNNSEKSWDCPCHGSRFSIDGETLTAPARKDLEKIDL